MKSRRHIFGFINYCDTNWDKFVHYPNFIDIHHFDRLGLSNNHGV